MNRRPRALDLFCGAGGASMGLFRAGFDVVGVDIRPQPRYPFAFVQADALAFDTAGFDFVWASPPCQAFSTATADRKGEHPNLIAPVRRMLEASGKPYIIENVASAPLLEPVKLDGAMFGLGVIRIRWFESNFFLMTPRPVRRAAGVADWCSVVGKGNRRDGQSGRIADWKRAMGIDWMIRRELTQAIPPAYSEFLGRQAPVAFLGRRAA